MRYRLLLALPLAAVGATWFFLLTLPWPVLLIWRDPGSTSFIDQRVSDAHSADREYEVRQDWVPLDEISRNLQRAVVLAEDGMFFEHHGIDWLALAEELHYEVDDDFSFFSPRDLGELGGALAYYIRNRDSVRGRSTITQQLAKNLYFSGDRSIVRKIGELVVARRLELFLSKERILELYLNIAEWGPGIFGAEAAARHYFGRSAARLTVDQSAALAATLPHPLTSNPALRPGRMNWRKQLILRLMRTNG